MQSQTGDTGTARSRAKAERRREILVASARLMAERGFHAVRLDDIGAAVGLTGPAIYRHFASKEEALAAMLIDISTRLRDGGLAALLAGGSPAEVLEALLAVHVEFVVTEPDLISVQFRDLGTLPEQPRRTVQVLQREYVGMWADTLRELHPDLDQVEALTRAHAVFGLLNSSFRLPALPEPRLRSLLAEMARAALRMPQPGHSGQE